MTQLSTARGYVLFMGIGQRASNRFYTGLQCVQTTSICACYGLFFNDYRGH